MPIEQWSDRVVIAHLLAEPHLREELQAVLDRLAQGPVDMVLDLGGVKHLNSSHIAQLLKVRKAALSAGRRLVLCAVDNHASGAFLVTGLDKVFEFVDAVPTALASLQLKRP